MIQTPNIKKLIAHKISVDAIPSGGGLKDAIAFLTDKDKIIATAREATKWVEEAIAVVKTSPDNPYKSDDEIAAAILQKIDEQKRKLHAR